MRLCFPNLLVTAALISAGAVLSQDVPSDVPVSVLLTSAQEHLTKGETNEALAYFDAAIARDPTNYLSFFKRATTYLSLGRANLATEDFNKVLALRPGFSGAHLQLAKIKAKAAEWDDARAEFAAAGEAPDSPDVSSLNAAEAAMKLAFAAEKAGQWEDCVNYAGEAIVVASRYAPLRETRSHCRFERGELEEGMGDLRHVLQMRPGDTTPHVVISAVSFYNLADFDAGLGQVRKCLHSDPDSKVCKKLHKQEKAVSKAFAKATNSLSKGQYTTASRALVGTEEGAGLLQTVQQQVDELRHEGRIPKKGRVILHERLVDMVCQAYVESTSKHADKYCEEALKLNEESFWGLLHRAKALIKKEEFEAAIQTLESAANAHPDRRDKINPLLNKAQIELKRSKTKDYYKVLGVAHDADEKQIKSAYRKASKQYHPDKAIKQGVTKEEAEKKMAAINEAYEVLSDPELRARFDRGDDPNSNEQRGNPFQGGSPFGGGQHWAFQQPGGGGQQFKFQFNGGPFGF
ncbi:TPR-like protein [Trichoderma longibrachiatum]|uniref:Tetratricopeptide repeat and J domain-containing co-chaperone DNJ1 n=1 Tax=Trichoderma longibrachiatum ATCC 18648 TaxID=983965 RepID=A0A2T4C6H3_TRILO|nr:TPR-like protein [Trichoderma longibrachiatum ATCC 18648]